MGAGGAAGGRADRLAGPVSVSPARAAARATDELVHENPWQSVAIAAAVGFFLGWLSGRR